MNILGAKMCKAGPRAEALIHKESLPNEKKTCQISASKMRDFTFRFSFEEACRQDRFQRVRKEGVFQVLLKE